jgi:hypothetical protein
MKRHPWPNSVVCSRDALRRNAAVFVPGPIPVPAESRADSAGKLILATTISDQDGDNFRSALGEGRIDGLLVASTLRTSLGDIVGAHMPWLYLKRQGPGARRYVCLDDERPPSWRSTTSSTWATAG